MIDWQLSSADVQALNSADGLAAFFAILGYDTDARLSQSPANLGITNETLTRQIRRMELLADQDSLLQVYLVELSSVTVQASRGLAAAFRNRPPNCLLVLTADYERLDFVLLDRSAPKRQTAGIGQRQVVVRPRVLTVDRRNPTTVQLRVLRRLSYTESDALAEYDKLRSAFDVAEWSEEHFNNRALFADHYLRKRLPDLPPWQEDPKPTFREFRSLLERAASRWAGKTEDEVRTGLIEPALHLLGFEPQPGRGGTDDRHEPDYLLRSPDGATLAACLAYTWNRSLDGKDDTRDQITPEENPGAVVVSLLERPDVPYAIVTNGKHWRLYAARAHSRASSYYEIDLEETLALDDPADAFRYFWLLFRRQAFSEGFTRDYATASLTLLKRELADIAGTIADEAVARLDRRFSANSFVLWDRLAALFRVVDRGDLKLNVPAYNGGLFRTEVADEEPGAEAETARFLGRHRLSDRHLARVIDRLARDVDEKTQALVPIDYKSLGVRQLGSIYEGLLEFRLRVAPEKMAVCKGKRTEEVVPYREAKASRRTILRTGAGRTAPERILPKGTLYPENDRRERKATGSYYTPDFIVKYIVERTVGPVLSRKLDAIASKFRAAQKALLEARGKHKALGGKSETPEHAALVKHRGVVDELFDLKVCDPAMGSGHFLVEVVDFATDRIVDFLNGFPWNPVIAELSETRETILREMEEQHVSIDPSKLTDVNLLRRRVLKRCVYGVDLNPMAVELAKVSLWLHCFTLGAPLSFLDHHLKTGNSLLGTSVDVVRPQLERDLFGRQFAGLMKATEAMIHVGELSDVTLGQLRESAQAFHDATTFLEPYVEVLDLWQSQHHGNRGVKAAMISGNFPSIEPGWRERLPAGGRDTAAEGARLTEEKRFFHWDLAFPELFFSRGTRKPRAGFDAVVGNPPWIRQEGLAADKAALSAGFPDVFDSVADTYVLFLGRGLQLLLPGGRLGMIVPNKWLRSGYGRKLREHLVATTPPVQLVDFGHAPIFPDADTFPLIAIFEEPLEEVTISANVAVCAIPRDELDERNLAGLVRDRSHNLSLARLRPDGWDLANVGLADLLEKIRRSGPPLKDYLGSSPLYGIKTGLNEAFLIDQATRDRLVAEDPRCEPLIKRFLRGRDVQRWHPEWGGEWIILLKSSENANWPWSHAGKRAEGLWAGAYASLYAWMKPQEERLKRRQDKGKFWWELRSCDYYGELESPKIMYQDISFHSRFTLERSGMYANNTRYFLISGDLALLGILNSSLIWWYLARSTTRGKDEAFRLHTIFIESVPIPDLPAGKREALEDLARRLIDHTQKLQMARHEYLDGIRTCLGPVRGSDRLAEFWKLTGEAARRELARCTEDRPSPSALQRATSLHQQMRKATWPLLAVISEAERQLQHAVCSLYDLTEVEARLLLDNLPPRDPVHVSLSTIGPGEDDHKAGEPTDQLGSSDV